MSHGTQTVAPAFDVFSFPFLQGDPETALAEPDHIVLTETAARKYFGGVNPIGRALAIDGVGTLEVAGVLRDLPANSHIRFEVMGSFLNREEAWRQYMQNWTINASTYTYVLLHEEASPETVQAKLPAFAARHTGRPTQDAYLRLSLQPLTAIRLHSDLRNELGPTGDVAYIYVFSTIALFILLIGCFNFMNLSTARAARRAKEIGIRKAFGATAADIATLLSKDFVKLVLIASAVAAPVAFLAMDRWLGHFAYRVELSGWIFLGASLAVLLIAWLTVSHQAIRAALAAPVESLRYE